MSRTRRIGGFAPALMLAALACAACGDDGPGGADGSAAGDTTNAADAGNDATRRDDTSNDTDSDDTSNDTDSDDTSNDDTDRADTASADTATSDADGADTASVDTATSDADGADAGGDGAGGDAAGDTGTTECVDGQARCDACVFDFRGADPERPSVRVIRIANDGPGDLRVSDASVVDASPLVSFSSSWVNYIRRVAPGWAANADATGFSPADGVITIADGEVFEVEIQFARLAGGTGCADDNACGRVLVEHTRCDGTRATVAGTIRR